jgi:hypothetical protein
MTHVWTKQLNLEGKKMATCDDFTITLKNSTDAEIKVTKVEYEDGSDFKTENCLGVDGLEKIEKDHSKSFKRNLQGIGGESTCLRVTYQHHIGGTTWGSKLVETTAPFTAHDNGFKTVTLTR